MRLTTRWLTRTVVAGAVLAVLACAGDGSSPTQPISSDLISSPTETLTGLASGLLSCEPLPAAETTVTLTKRGGTIGIGPHQLVVPKGALTGSVSITARITPNTNAATVEFFPEGLRFRTPATVTLSYANCQSRPGLKSVAHVSDDLLQILEVLTSTDDSGRKTTSAPLDHFSRYAVAW